MVLGALVASVWVFQWELAKLWRRRWRGCGRRWFTDGVAEGIAVGVAVGVARLGPVDVGVGVGVGVRSWPGCDVNDASHTKNAVRAQK